MNTKIRLEILALTAAVLFSLPVFAPSRAAGFSPTAPLKPANLVLVQSGDTPAPEPILLTDEQKQYPLGRHLEILEDPSGELTIEEVSSPLFDAQFVPSQVEVPNYGFTDSVYWVRMNLDNGSRLTDEWLLELGFANMQFVDLYTPLPDGEGFEVKQTGTLRPAYTRDVLYPRIVFDLFIPTQSQKTYYLRFQNGASMTIPLTLWTKDGFWIYAQREQMRDWLFFGAIIALLAYHLFLLYSLREIIYLYFVLWLASLFVSVFTYDGYLGIYLFPNLYSIPTFFPLTFSLLLTTIVLFSDAFLELKTRLPNFHRVSIGFIASWGALMLLSLFTSYNTYARLVVPWAIITIAVMGVAGIATWRKGFHPVGFLMLAWLGMGAGLILVMLVQLLIISSTNFSEHIYHLGMVWMAVCWSFALADRINILKAETDSANRNLQKSERRLSKILEGMPLAVVLYGKDKKPKYANRRTMEILSNSAENIYPDPSFGRTLAQAIHYFSLKRAGSSEEYPEEKMPVFGALKGFPASIDDVEIDQGDRRIPLEMWANPVTDDAGNVESAVLVFQDITRRKQAEAELLEYRKQLESLMEKRTADLNTLNTDLNAANKELMLRLEWLSAIVLTTETIARSSDFTQIYEKILEIINRLFAIPDSFIAELDVGSKQLKILAHSCRSEYDPDLIGSVTLLPEGILPDSSLEPGKFVLLSRDLLNLLSGPIGIHIQDAKIQSILLVPLHLRQRVFGFLGLEIQEGGRIIKQEESNLLSVFSIDIAQLIQDSHLFEQTKALITAEERNRLARDLHDSVTQTLFTASVLAEATPRIWNKDREIARQNMEKLSLLIRGALAEMRSMLIELRAGELQNQTLDQLLTTLVEAARARTHAVITLSIIDLPELPKDVTLAFYRIAREALNNALVHAAAAQINISLRAETGQVELHIQDDGCGFDPQAVPADHLGISIMRERAAKIGGEVRIRTESEQGTEITISWTGKVGGTAEYE